MKTPQGNGKGSPGENLPVKTEINAPAPPAIMNGSQETESLKLHPMQNAPLSVEETIKRVNILQENINKRKVLQKHLERVESLKFGEYDDEKDTITITASNKTHYEIRSTALCIKVAALVRNEISAHIEEIEEEIVL
jgi:hypothetical protein